jgi:hypothetical protein
MIYISVLFHFVLQATEDPTSAWDFWMVLRQFSVPLSRTGLTWRTRSTRLRRAMFLACLLMLNKRLFRQFRPFWRYCDIA